MGQNAGGGLTVVYRGVLHYVFRLYLGIQELRRARSNLVFHQYQRIYDGAGFIPYFTKGKDNESEGRTGNLPALVPELRHLPDAFLFRTTHVRLYQKHRPGSVLANPGKCGYRFQRYHAVCLPVIEIAEKQVSYRVSYYIDI